MSATSEQQLTAKLKALIKDAEKANLGESTANYHFATGNLAWWVIRHADRIVITPKPEPEVAKES